VSKHQIVKDSEASKCWSSKSVGPRSVGMGPHCHIASRVSSSRRFYFKISTEPQNVEMSETYGSHLALTCGIHLGLTCGINLALPCGNHHSRHVAPIFGTFGADICIISSDTCHPPFCEVLAVDVRLPHRIQEILLQEVFKRNTTSLVNFQTHEIL
jgi:hypothetical protein